MRLLIVISHAPCRPILVDLERIIVRGATLHTNVAEPRALRRLMPHISVVLIAFLNKDPLAGLVFPLSVVQLSVDSYLLKYLDVMAFPVVCVVPPGIVGTLAARLGTVVLRLLLVWVPVLIDIL